MNEYEKALARAEGEIVRAAVALMRTMPAEDPILVALMDKDWRDTASKWVELVRAVHELWEV